MKQKLLYIMGYARSGSTALSSLLGMHSGIFAGGELSLFLEVLQSKVEYCSCGKPVAACSFWLEVLANWQEAIGTPSEAYCNVPASFRHGRLTYRPRMAATGDDWRRYVAQSLALFRSLAQVSGKNIILDSSKSARRALALSQIADLDLRVVHIVRDVRGVALSRSRNWSADPQGGIGSDQFGQAFSSTALDWLRENLRANQLRRRLGERCHLVRYEDLVKRPMEIVNEIGALVDIDMNELAPAVETNYVLVPGHQIAGNRMRLQAEVSLAADSKWHTELSWQQKLGIWLLASPVAQAYGYAPWRESRDDVTRSLAGKHIRRSRNPAIHRAGRAEETPVPPGSLNHS